MMKIPFNNISFSWTKICHGVVNKLQENPLDWNKKIEALIQKRILK